MNIRNRVIESLGLVTQRQLESATHSAYINGYNDGNDEPPSGTLVTYSYRQNTTGGGRDPKLSWDDLCNAAWRISQDAPIADRGLELKRDHILGRGVEITSKSKSLQDAIDIFKNVNQFDTRIREYVLQLFLFGVQCFPAVVRQSDGRVKLNYIDPQQIDDVVAHPYNPTEMWAVVIKPMEGLPAWAGGNIPKRVYRIIREDTEFVSGNKVISPNNPDRLVTADQARQEPWEAAMLSHYGLSVYTGSCFYFRINHVSNQRFGASDLQRIIYWIERFEESGLSAADRENSSGYWFTDVKMTGATPEQVRQRTAELKRQPPPRGGINVHNDREETEIKQPTASAGNVEVLNALFNYAWGGLGFPRHWYVQGDGTNRATAQEQDEPVEKTLQSDQDSVKEMITQMITFVRDQAVIAGYPGIGEDDEFKVVLPEIASRNLDKLGQALKGLTETLDTAIAKKLVSTETARMMWAKLVIELGVEVDPAEEAKRIEAEEPKEPATFDQITGQPHPDPDIAAAPTIEAATQIAVEKVRLGQSIDGRDNLQDEINEAVRIAQASWKLENGNGHH